MSVEVVTKEDLQAFRVVLLNDLKQLIGEQKQPVVKKWLKSAEVRELLSLSAGKLQNLRISGRLPFSRIGGILYYQYEVVEKLLGRNSN